MPSPAGNRRFDYVLVGGGLANALTALAVLDRNPGARLALVERGTTFGGNHTWSFHDGDVAPAADGVVQPLVAHAWPAYAVAFPGFERTLPTGYNTVTSQRLHQVLAARLRASPGAAAYTGREARHVGADHVILDDGARLDARLVIDARGPRADDMPAGTGFQKFVGLELELGRPMTATLPTLMDARVDQIDGFRFVYVLPLAVDRVLVEDTVYSTGSSLDTPALESRVLAYATRHLGLAVEHVVRREAGVLPLPLHAPSMADVPGPLRAGYAGGWFHPTTGYSFPMAVRLAMHVATHAPESVRGAALARLAATHERQARFAALLNRLLFGAVAPAQRRNVLARFYRLPEPTIRRFYAMTTTAGDRARIVCGRPPEGLSLGAAIARGIAS